MRTVPAPEMQRFARTAIRSVPNNGLIIAANPQRVAIFFSTSLSAGIHTYTFGDTVDSGIVFRYDTSLAPLLVCAEEIGDAVQLPVWNISGTSRFVSYVETWVEPTGRCACPDEDAILTQSLGQSDRPS